MYFSSENIDCYIYSIANGAIFMIQLLCTCTVSSKRLAGTFLLLLSAPEMLLHWTSSLQVQRNCRVTCRGFPQKGEE